MKDFITAKERLMFPKRFAFMDYVIGLLGVMCVLVGIFTITIFFFNRGLI